tara:strand:+ start:94 stop:504 length:411 start_codon:yes stop_codon:yes gene_type:complete
MKKLFFNLILTVGLCFAANAQNEKGDWYVGTGDITNVAWTDWAVSPSLGYAVTGNLVLGGSVSQIAEEDMDLDMFAKYFFKGYFAGVNLDGFSTEGMVFELGKMFTFHKGVYVAPSFRYDYDAETMNLGFGFGMKF